MRGCGGFKKANQVLPEDDGKKRSGPRGFERTFKSTQGEELHAYFWPAEGEPRAVVQLLHGTNTYIDFDYLKFKSAGQPHEYESSWVEEMNRRGFAVCGFDFAGFGRSGGKRGLIKRFEDLVEDTLALARDLRNPGRGVCATNFAPAGTPHFLAGYGLGGLVGVAASLRQPGWFTGLLLISPLLLLPEKTKEAKGPRSSVSSAAGTSPVEWISEAYEKDPLVVSDGLRAHTLKEILKATQRMGSEEGDPPGMGCVSVPLLVLQGDGDTVADPNGAELLVKRAATHEKKLRTVPLAWHALIKEEEHSGNLLDESLGWMDEQCSTDRAMGLFQRARAGGAFTGKRKPESKGKGADDDGEGNKLEEGAPASEQQPPRGAGGLPGAVNGDGDAEKGPKSGASSRFSSRSGRDPAFGGDASSAAAAVRMAAVAAATAEDDAAQASGPRAHSRKSRGGSSSSSDSAKEVDWDGERAGDGEDDEAQRAKRRVSGEGQLLPLGHPKLSPYDRPDGRDADKDEGMAERREEEDVFPERQSSAELEAGRRWGLSDRGSSSKGFMTAYGSKKGMMTHDSSNDGADPDPFAPRPLSPRPPMSSLPPPSHLPSSLPPLGPSRFAPLPPIGFGR